MPEMFFCVLAVYNNVIDIYQRKVSQMADENPLAHVALEGPGGILQAKRHNVPFVEPPSGVVESITGLKA